MGHNVSSYRIYPLLDAQMLGVVVGTCLRQAGANCTACPALAGSASQ